MRKRTRAREFALQYLFMTDLRKEDPPGPQSFLAGETDDTEVAEYAVRLVQGVLDHRKEIDEKIRAVAHNWDLSRMAAVDRNVLRMAVHEILHCQDIPPKVSINEAVDLGKKFSTANSGAFINGILDKIRISQESKS